MALTDRLLDTAAPLAPASLRILDAIHLAAAMTAGPRLEAVVTYDDRKTTAAREAGLTLAQPVESADH
ncbi:MAG TPA: hypothetical protein VLZ05_09475 [Mycobacterium sp.]|nr:hypothetical protein [Mycobacterium sp.]HUH69079.1 hypothetical protein [Mycobacterium sp.]